MGNKVTKTNEQGDKEVGEHLTPQQKQMLKQLQIKYIQENQQRRFNESLIGSNGSLGAAINNSRAPVPLYWNSLAPYNHDHHLNAH